MIQISSDGRLTVTSHSDTEANIDTTQMLDDAAMVDDESQIDDLSEVEVLLGALLGITTSQIETDKIRLDFRGNLVAKVVENPSANKISVGVDKVITVKELIIGGV